MQVVDVIGELFFESIGNDLLELGTGLGRQLGSVSSTSVPGTSTGDVAACGALRGLFQRAGLRGRQGIAARIGENPARLRLRLTRQSQQQPVGHESSVQVPVRQKISRAKNCA